MKMPKNRRETHQPSSQPFLGRKFADIIPHLVEETRQKLWMSLLRYAESLDYEMGEEKNSFLKWGFIYELEFLLRNVKIIFITK